VDIRMPGGPGGRGRNSGGVPPRRAGKPRGGFTQVFPFWQRTVGPKFAGSRRFRARPSTPFQKIYPRAPALVAARGGGRRSTVPESAVRTTKKSAHLGE